MAKTADVSKGGLSITNAVLVVLDVRYLRSVMPAIPEAPPSLPQWWVRWALYASQADADVPLGAGPIVAQGDYFVLYQKNKDPVDDAENMVFDKFKESGWSGTLK